MILMKLCVGEYLHHIIMGHGGEYPCFPKIVMEENTNDDKCQVRGENPFSFMLDIKR